MAEFSKDFRAQETLHKLKEQKKKKEDELTKLEEQKKKELEDAEKEIKATTEILKKKEKDKDREVEEVHHAKTKNHAREDQTDTLTREIQEIASTLEEIVAQEKITTPPQQIDYLTDTLRPKEAPLYAVTNYHIYSHLQEIRNKASSGEYISNEERQFVEEARKQTQRFVSDQDYLALKDPLFYVSRSEDILRQIDSYVHLRKTK
jgi:seryl-tRNA synthetase